MKSVERNPRNRLTSASCSSAIHGEPRKEKKRNGSASESEGRWRARKEGRGRLGDVAGRKNGIALHDGNAERWELQETSASIPHPVRHREKGG